MAFSNVYKCQGNESKSNHLKSVSLILSLLNIYWYFTLENQMKVKSTFARWKTSAGPALSTCFYHQLRTDQNEVVSVSQPPTVGDWCPRSGDIFVPFKYAVRPLKMVTALGINDPHLISRQSNTSSNASRWSAQSVLANLSGPHQFDFKTYAPLFQTIWDNIL